MARILRDTHDVLINCLMSYEKLDQLGRSIAYFAQKQRIPAVVAVSGQDISPVVFTVQLTVQRVR